MPDAVFAEPRLAAVYDALDGDRDDLDLYLRLLDGAASVVDVGCGTGSLACLLAARGVAVTAVDPAAASLDVARRKPGADRVRWVLGDATALPPLTVDAAVMTGNVAQVFLTDDDWHASLRGIHAAVRPGGRLVFEVRDPAREAWREWTKAHTHRTVDVPATGLVEAWCDVLDAVPPLVTFRWTFVFARDGATLTSDSTLRFRERAEVEASLAATGYAVEDVLDAPDRPGTELVFVCYRY